jgi:hypothetical protein
MSAMASVYQPKEGRYTVAGGTLKLVQDFRRLQHQVVEGGQAIAVPAQEQAQAVQKMVDERLNREAPEGVTPIKVNLPISGTVLRFQKILVLDEPLIIDLKYTYWPGYSTGWLW